MSDLSILRYFNFEHLPENLQKISKPFHDLAVDMSTRLPSSRQTEMMLEDLLKAKDSAVRAFLDYGIKDPQ